MFKIVVLIFVLISQVTLNPLLLDSSHPETLGNHFEGDIVYDPFMDESLQLNGVVNPSSLWPKSTGSKFVNVPYIIENAFSKSIKFKGNRHFL
jgi:hypothetical protein